MRNHVRYWWRILTRRCINCGKALGDDARAYLLGHICHRCFILFRIFGLL